MMPLSYLINDLFYRFTQMTNMISAELVYGLGINVKVMVADNVS